MRSSKKQYMLLIMTLIGVTACNNGHSSNTGAQNEPLSYIVDESGSIYFANGESWNKLESARVPSAGSIKCGLSSCVAVSGSDLLVSNDLSHWRVLPKAKDTLADSSEKLTENSDIYDRTVITLSDGNSLIVTAGSKGKILVGSDTIKDSNGNLYPMEQAPSVTTDNLYSITFDYNSKQLIAVGDTGTILEASISDLSQWRRLHVADENRSLYAISCGNNPKDNSCIIVGKDGVILVTDDGYSWTAGRGTNGAGSFYAISDNKLRSESIPQMYVAGGKHQIFYSSDRLNWTQAIIPDKVMNQSYSVYEIIYGQDEFFARIALADGSNVNGYLVSADNGKSWEFLDLNARSSSQEPTCDSSSRCKSIHIIAQLSEFFVPPSLSGITSEVLLMFDGTMDKSINSFFKVKAKNSLKSGMNAVFNGLVAAGGVVNNGIDTGLTKIKDGILGLAQPLTKIGNTIKDGFRKTFHI